MGLANLGPLLVIDCVGLNVVVLPESGTMALAQWSGWVLGMVGPGLFWRHPPGMVPSVSVSDGDND